MVVVAYTCGMVPDGTPVPPTTELTRRQWLALTGAGSLSALAGCGGDAGPGQAQGTPPESSDQTFLTTEFNSIDNHNYNPFDILYFPLQSPEYIFGTLFHVYEVDGERGLLSNLVDVEEVDHQNGYLTIEDQELVLPLREEFTWHDGDPVTAEDVATRFELERLMEWPTWDVLANVEAVDDYAVRFEFDGDPNEPVVTDYFATHYIACKRDVYDQFLPEEDMEDMETWELTQLRGELLSFTTREPGDLVGWGLWEMAERDGGNQTFTLTVHEDHPHADRVNFPEVRFEWYPTEEQRQQNLLSGNFAALDVVPNHIMSQQVPDRYTRYDYRRRTGWGWAFNYDHEYFQDRRIRQAMAYAIDKETVVGNSGIAEDYVQPHEFDTGLFEGVERQEAFFGQGYLDEITQYNHDTDRATELLEDAGWSRDDGQWYDGDGDPVELTITVCVMWPEQLQMAETTAEQLRDFGIDADFRSEELVVYYGETMIQADYDMAAWITGSTRADPFRPQEYLWTGCDCTTDEHNFPEEVEVPMPVGDQDGDLETVNWRELLAEIQRTPIEEAQDLYREITWVYNQSLPVYCLNEEDGVTFLDTSRWRGPDPDDPDANLNYAPIQRMAGNGFVQAMR